MSIDPQEFGRLQASVDTLVREVRYLRKDVTALMEWRNQGKGAWFALVTVGGFAGAISEMVIRNFVLH